MNVIRNESNYNCNLSESRGRGRRIIPDPRYSTKSNTYSRKCVGVFYSCQVLEDSLFFMIQESNN